MAEIHGTQQYTHPQASSFLLLLPLSLSRAPSSFFLSPADLSAAAASLAAHLSLPLRFLLSPPLPTPFQNPKSPHGWIRFVLNIFSNFKTLNRRSPFLRNSRSCSFAEYAKQVAEETWGKNKD
ncbi:hypothetical protein Droror1_Dr00008447, partial [Drosera rotundifolia]